MIRLTFLLFTKFAGSSMAMLGNTVFVFAYDEDALKNLNIENFYIDKLNNIGIVYD